MKKKKMRWPLPRNWNRTDFQAVPLPTKEETCAAKDPAFGDFNGQLREQDGGKRDKEPKRQASGNP